MNEPSPYTPPDPELEARIVAMVLGEAADFEREQLRQLIDQQPDLAAFESQIQAVHARLQAVVTGDRGDSNAAADRQDAWQLPDDKRQTLLTKIDRRGEPSPERKSPERKSAGSTRRYSPRSAWNYPQAAKVLGSLAGIAAMLVLIGLMLPTIHMARESSRSISYLDADFESAGEPADAAASHLSSDDQVMYDDLTVPNEEYFQFESGFGDNGVSNDLFGKLALPSDDNSDGAASEWAEIPAPRGEAILRGSVRAPQTNWGLPADETAADEMTRFAAPGQSSSGNGQPSGGDGQAGLPAESRMGGMAMDMDMPQGMEMGKGGESGGMGGGFGGMGMGMDMPPTDGPQQDPGGDPLAGIADPLPALRPSAEPEGEEDFGRRSRFYSDTKAGRSLGLPGPAAVTNAPATPQPLAAAPVTRNPVAGTTTEALDAIANEHLMELEDLEGQLEQAKGKDFSYQFRDKQEVAQRQLGQIADLRKSDESDLRRGKKLPAVVAGKQVEADYLLPKFQTPTSLQETDAAVDAFSTFSLHVSDVSFKLAYAALAAGEAPQPAKIRIEEFVNAFDYRDPMPSHSEKVACRVEQAVHPFLQQRNVLRVSMRTAAAGRASSTPLRLTLLLDNSGSMERLDRQQTVRRAVAQLAQQLTPADRVTLISFARQPRLLADQVPGDQTQQLLEQITNLPSEGGTNIEAALQLAFEKARQQQLEGAQNRIVLLTDGAVNLGNADPERLSQQIIAMRDAGVAFDAAGISAEGLNDEVLEALTRQGDGRYYLLDTFESVDDGFASQLAGALRPSAKNVKVQIEFNPRRVGRYKLLGFEKHRLNKEDFRNDAVDAAEMAAAEAGVAVYQFEAKPDGEGDVGSVSVRFRDLSSGQMVEHRWPIPYVADAPRIDQAPASLQIASSAALLAAKLRGEPLGETVDLKTLSQLIAELPPQERRSQRVQQLRQMIEQTRSLGF